MTSKSVADSLLREAEQAAEQYSWEGPFAEYLRMVIENPSVSRLSHKIAYDAIVDHGGHESATGDPVYGLFEDKIFGLDNTLDKIVQYFYSASRRLEIRKRILLLMGPPASGKSSIAALIKHALERHTRTDRGAVYAIKGCPMQEEPLHLIPDSLRPKLLNEHGIYIEGELCPRCRFMFNAEYLGNSADVPIVRVVFSEPEAVGIGYYVATNPNPMGAALLVGSINDDKLEGDRLDVAGKAFRLDGEFNVANRGMIEFVEIFKSDSHLLTALLGLSQEQLIKMERFGSVYADEIIIAHSNEGDFQTFMAKRGEEALRDRIIAIQIPYNVRVTDEVKIYNAMLDRSGLEDVHLPPLTLPVMSVFAVLSRLMRPAKQGVSLLDKMRAYDGLLVRSFSADDVELERRHYPNEAMSGVSPRYVMNRLSAAATTPGITCIFPLIALDSLWRGLSEYLNPQEVSLARYMSLIKETVEEYSERAIRDVQRAFEDRFEETAAELLNDYLDDLKRLFSNETVRDKATGSVREPDEGKMSEMESHTGVTVRNRPKFRWEIYQFFNILNRKGVKYDYTSELRMKAAIDARLFPDRRTLANTLSKPRSGKNQVEWARRRGVILNRLVNSYGYCQHCAHDTFEYVIHVLKNKSVLRTPRKEAIEWQWPLDPSLTPTTAEGETEASDEEGAAPA